MTTNTRPAGPSIFAVALDLFRKVSTATLTTQMFKRGFRNVYVRRATVIRWGLETASSSCTPASQS
jgi:hypothetical protein